MPDIDALTVLKFLGYVEGQRRNQVQSRNVRLAAIRSLCRMVALRDPVSVAVSSIISGSRTLLVQVRVKQPLRELGIEAVRIRPFRTSAS